MVTYVLICICYFLLSWSTVSAASSFTSSLLILLLLALCDFPLHRLHRLTPPCAAERRGHCRPRPRFAQSLGVAACIRYRPVLLSHTLARSVPSQPIKTTPQTLIVLMPMTVWKGILMLLQVAKLRYVGQAGD
jgi:hypothetical protein